MLEAFIAFIILRGVIVAIIAWACKVGAALLACLIIGTILEGIASILLGEVDEWLVFKEIMYYGGLLLQLIAMLIVTIPMYSLPQKEISFLMAVSFGMIGILSAVGWFANGFEGVASIGYYYGATAITVGVEGILYGIMMTNTHTLVIANTVLVGISIIVILIARLKMGSNLE